MRDHKLWLIIDTMYNYLHSQLVKYTLRHSVPVLSLINYFFNQRRGLFIKTLLLQT